MHPLKAGTPTPALALTREEVPDRRGARCSSNGKFLAFLPCRAVLGEDGEPVTHRLDDVPSPVSPDTDALDVELPSDRVVGGTRGDQLGRAPEFGGIADGAVAPGHSSSVARGEGRA
jgi:hypothetical protein